MQNLLLIVLQNLFIVVFIAAFIAFSITIAVMIVCFNEMEEDIKRRSKAYIILAMTKAAIPMVPK